MTWILDYISVCLSVCVCVYWKWCKNTLGNHSYNAMFQVTKRGFLEELSQRGILADDPRVEPHFNRMDDEDEIINPNVFSLKLAQVGV